MFLTELFSEATDNPVNKPVLVGIFHRPYPANAKIYVWRVGKDHYELETSGAEKRIPVNLHFGQLVQTLERKGFTESQDFSDLKVIINEVYVSAAEKKMNPGVEVGKHVAVKAPGFEYMVKFGIFKHIGPSGLATVILNEPLASNGERRIAVPPAWLYADTKSALPNGFQKKKKEQGELL